MSFGSSMAGIKTATGSCQRRRISDGALSSESADGNLAHHVVVRASGYEFGEVRIRGIISIQQFFDGEERTKSELRLRSNPTLRLEFTDWTGGGDSATDW
ncbi:hypothetical protein Dimus_024154 [Dionaea muscipula]